MQLAYRESDERAAAVRVALTGRTPLYPAIERRPHRLRQTALELADEIADDDMWIEKLVNNTTVPGDRSDGGLSEEAHEVSGTRAAVNTG